MLRFLKQLFGSMAWTIARTRSDHRAASSPRNKAQLCVEQLEDRQQLSALSVVSGVVTYQSDNAVANKVGVSLVSSGPHAGTYAIHDEAEVIWAPGLTGSGTNTVFVPVSDASTMNIYLGDGHDTITVSSTSIAINVYGGLGDDTFNLGNSSLDQIRASVFIYDGADYQGGGFDQLNLNDQATTSFQTYHMLPQTDANGRPWTRVTRSGGGSISYRDMDFLTLNAGSGGNSITLTANVNPVLVNGGAGDDTLRLTYYYASVIFHGNAGLDSLSVDGRWSGSALSITITSQEVQRSFAGPLPPASYDTVEHVTVYGGSNDDSIVVRSTNAATSYAIAGAGGSNTYSVGGAGNLNAIQGAVTFFSIQDVTNGTDFLRIDDSKSSGNHTYTHGMTPNPGIYAITRDGAALISYYAFYGMKGVQLDASGGSNAIKVTATAPACPVTVNAGAGDSTTTVGGGLIIQPVLGTIQAPVRINGQGGYDNVIVDDSAFTGNASYTVSASTVIRAGTPVITYATVEKVALKAGRGSDTIEVQSTSASTHVIVNAGAGDDRIKLGDSGNAGTLAGAVAVKGEAGTDTLDYLQYPGSTPVFVNLGTGRATGASDGVTGIENIIGGLGNDILIGDAGVNVLNGSSGRDLLIGGTGMDQLLGGPGQDILIGGSTVYDANTAALLAIMAEWARGDQSYEQRVAHLRLGGGHNGSILLNTSKVISDGTRDELRGSLTGGIEPDWFFRGNEDYLADLADGERVN